MPNEPIETGYQIPRLHIGDYVEVYGRKFVLVEVLLRYKTKPSMIAFMPYDEFLKRYDLKEQNND